MDGELYYERLKLCGRIKIIYYTTYSYPEEKIHKKETDNIFKAEWINF